MTTPIGIVNIYYDPITQNQIEDKATLIEKIAELGDGMEIWRVKLWRDKYVTERILRRNDGS